MKDDYTLIPYGQAIRPDKLDADFAKYLISGRRMTFEEYLRAAADGQHIEGLANLLEPTALENSGLQQRLTAADQRIDELISAIRSINRAKHHEVFVPGDDEPSRGKARSGLIGFSGFAASRQRRWTNTRGRQSPSRA